MGPRAPLPCGSSPLALNETASGHPAVAETDSVDWLSLNRSQRCLALVSSSAVEALVGIAIHQRRSFTSLVVVSFSSRTKVLPASRQVTSAVMFGSTNSPGLPPTNTQRRQIARSVLPSDAG